MATDFFQRQDAARRNTTFLVVMFLVAVVAIVVVTFIAAAAATKFVADSQQRSRQVDSRSGSELPDPITAGTIAALAALVLISGGTLYKVTELRSGGGRSVAESIGGQQLRPNHTGAIERRVLNVVEEMAIASGTTVPPVFLLEDDAINAFAAGYASGDAVIGVTRGACEQLSREELQGVIAHEFSHVLNGDMRVNIRLIGILHGILLLSLIGKMLLYSLRFGAVGRRQSRDDGKGLIVILAIGVTLYLLGSLGALIGGLIKAGVSRQREYLADASAVQYTRNPGGIGGALMRIGAEHHGSRLQHPNAAVASHMYFAQGVFEGLSGLMATHPPLPKRIRAILPDWNGRYPDAAPASRGSQQAVTPGSVETARGFAAGPTATAPVIAAAATTALARDPIEHADPGTRYLAGEIADHVAHPEEIHRLHAARLLESIPIAIHEAAHEPATARSIVVALLLDPDLTVRERQLREAGKQFEPTVIREAESFWRQLAQGPPAHRLPLLDLTLPALASMSAKQFDTFSNAIEQLIRADDRLSLFEWTLSQVLMRHLEPRFRPQRPTGVRYYSLARLSRSISVLLSIVARIGHRGDTVAAAFDAGLNRLPGVHAELLPTSECTLDNLRVALEQLAIASAPRRRELVDACAAAICVDEHVTVAEAELLRGIADLLDCPVPPLVAETALRGMS